MSYYIQCGELFHYGVLGMRWGVRRYQNIDGSLTEAGKDHRAKYVAKEQKRLMKQYARYEKKYKRKADKAANSFKNGVDPRYANAARTGAEVIRKRRGG